MYSIDMLLPLKLAVTNAFTFKKPTVSVDSLWGGGGGGGGEGENLLLPRLQFALAPNFLCALQPT